MKRKNKEINIFSMSALDLFASAMGAFMLIALIALPYYLKTDHTLQQQLREVRAQLSEAQDKNDSLTQQLTACEQETNRLTSQLQQATNALEQCEQQLSATFLVVMMRWVTSRHDVDLHVVDPDGNEFYYDKHNRANANGQRPHFPATQAQLTEDMTNGPGTEIWEIPVAAAGTYKVYFNFYSRGNNNNPAKVSGSIYYRNGMHRISERHFTTPTPSPNLSNMTPVATIVVRADGQVSIQ